MPQENRLGQGVRSRTDVAFDQASDSRTSVAAESRAHERSQNPTERTSTSLTATIHESADKDPLNHDSQAVNQGSDGLSAEDARGTMDLEVDMEQMQALGLPVQFDSTNGKRVGDADVSAARVVKKRRYRQYMNRPGGFNRPLDPG